MRLISRALRKLRAGFSWVWASPANLRNAHYRRRFFMWARVGVAIAAWFGTVMLAGWRYDAFLSALLQAILIACIVCTAMALFPFHFQDEEEARRYVSIFDRLSQMLLGVAALSALLYGVIIAISITLY